MYDLFFLRLIFSFPFNKSIYTFVTLTYIRDEQTKITNQLNIEISEEISEGVYANLAIITHSHAEFIIDFVNVMPGTPKSKVKSRIILTPTHAKRCASPSTTTHSKLRQTKISFCF
jgi:hypothetical protein